MRGKRCLDGLWKAEEDLRLKTYIEANGVERWSTLPQKACLKRCGKSCRLRWMNYLHPNVKRGHISAGEEELIIRLHKLLGNRWSLIAARVPGRTDNDIKNFWNIHLSKKLGCKDIDLNTPNSSTAKATFNKKVQSAQAEQYNKGRPGVWTEGKVASQSSGHKSLYPHKLSNLQSNSIAVPVESKQLEHPCSDLNTTFNTTSSYANDELHITVYKTQLQEDSHGILRDYSGLSIQNVSTSNKYHREAIISNMERCPDSDSFWVESLPWLESNQGNIISCNYVCDATSYSTDVHP